VGCVTVGADGRIKDINRKGAEMLGWAARWLVGRSLGKWVLSDDTPLFEAHLRAAALSRQGVSERLRVKNRHGRIRDMRWESVAARGAGDGADQVVTVMIDMSEDRKQERLARLERAKLLQAGRVNMLGEIAAGLAHDLSQPLGAILLNSTVGLELVRNRPAADPGKLQDTLERVCESAAYAAEVVRHLRRFLRSGSAQPKPVDLNALMRDAARMVVPDASDHDVTIRLSLTPTLPPALADDVQIEQVVLNLLRNSIEAMQSSDSYPREITIRTERVEHAELLFSITDTGPGVAPQNISRLFDPLFTTKPGGMGLGLSISRSIVEAHAGRLWVGGSPESGATFYCSLPMAAARSS
jgi:PAS domain S-box-containing protein